MIRLSTGTAALVGLNSCVPKVLPTTAYIMSGQNCLNRCGFCAQSADSTSAVSLLSRVTWPEFPFQRTIQHLSAAYGKGLLKRVCIQVVGHGDDLHTLYTRIALIKETIPKIPLSISVAVTSLAPVKQIFDHGADIINVSLDGASQQVFEDCKKRSWKDTWSLLIKASELYPNRIHTHIIAGLGETERDVVDTLQKCSDHGIGTGLFAFTPIKGTLLENRPQPPLPSYRKLQAARYLITHGHSRAEQLACNLGGNITGFGIPAAELKKILGNGKAFETSGCQHCNRPYYNERPGQLPYNFPRLLTKQETEQAIDATVQGMIGTS